MYAKIVNGQIIEYPANPATENPFISFPLHWGGGVVGDNEYVKVIHTPQPTANIGWQYVETNPTPGEEVWLQTWSAKLLPKPEIKLAVSSKRYEVEVGGVVIANNRYSTDRESQTKYVAVALDISQANVETWNITWKTADNQFVNLNAPQMLSVINGVRSHVQNCFDKESEYYALIDTANTEVLEATDFSAGWPSNN